MGLPRTLGATTVVSGKPVKAKAGEKKNTSSITVRPEKNQDKKIPDQAKK